ncbi:MBOAT family O-acyltransferase [Zavarzinia compransoris]|uniref:Probable alginate O-acetylase AlgI n=1 Tax=Zavarzinia compransoris TaxID=1264899 RepID=A0A317E1G8_9PROT|nr:MBOAT family protein [Zavarzinia compransoris]PWR19980.1 MBOAT family protein [Zavarzinia compransoris]TDP44905.1 alginate O-acetyltransferase complex protein AlgI [Zavarzinia compransoris]
MVFASVEFLTLFLPLFLLCYALVPAGGRNWVLLIASWAFYGWWKPVFLLLLIGVTVFSYFCGLAIEAARSDAEKQRRLALGAAANLLVLGWFKYANLLVGTTNEGLALFHLGAIPWETVILPIGVSFYILQAISYLYDIRRGTITPERDFVAFAVYKAFFTQLVAGPVIRYSWIDKELTRRDLRFDNFAKGSRRFMLGFCMKVLIADQLAGLVDLVFALPAPSLADAWLGALGYTLQLYFDFAGYSAMAIGLALMLGFHFPENFNDPYLSTSIQEFWRRWHISLSGWLRDYLYVAMGGNRQGEARTYANLILTMAIGGLWHGAAWTFMAWGLVHGIALAVERAGRRRGIALPTVLAWPATMALVMLAWTLFRSTSWQMAETMLLGQVGWYGIGLGDAVRVALHPTVTLWLAAGVAVALWPAVRGRLAGALALVPGWWHGLWPVLAFLYALAALKERETVPFLYFQF